MSVVKVDREACRWRGHKIDVVEAALFSGVGTCEACGAEFVRRRATKRFCSRRCKNRVGQRAYWERKRAAE